MARLGCRTAVSIFPNEEPYHPPGRRYHALEQNGNWAVQRARCTTAL
jgi:hypothetical protein